MKLYPFIRCFWLPLILVWCFPWSGQSQAGISLFDTLYRLQDIHITITCPFDSLYRTNQEEIDAKITITSAAGTLLEDEDMTLNLRGKFRRMKCDWPPLLLNFKKSTLRKLELNETDEIKLVTHCEGGGEGLEDLEEERLCYQIYATLTPLSYRTIRVTTHYKDALNQKKEILSKGFLLEPDKVISARLGLTERKIYNIAEDSLSFESYSHAVAFNFMVGNRDWSIVSSRNAKLFYRDSIGKYVVIPYDFDFANVVGAMYRRDILPPSMDDPFDRIYEGEYFKSREGMILKNFIATQPAVMNTIITSDTELTPNRRKKIIRYLEEWYAEAEKTKIEKLVYGVVFNYKGGL